LFVKVWDKFVLLRISRQIAWP